MPRPAGGRRPVRVPETDSRLESGPGTLPALTLARVVPESLSIDEARKLVLASQGVPRSVTGGSAEEATRRVIRHLGYVQIDTISVIERAHHHTLWNRNPRYRQAHLDRLVAKGRVFEYWSHAAAYLPMEDYRFALPRMLAERGGGGRWHSKDVKLMRRVLARIREEGPLMSRDFEDTGSGRREMWDWKPAKYALEQLFIEGRIMSVRREGFNKVYDLTERVLPEGTDTSAPDSQEFARYLVTSFLRANGLGRVTDFVHLRQGMRDPVTRVVRAMVRSGEILEVRVRDGSWLVLPDSLDLLDHRLQREKACLLSPFDNLVIQRRRVRELFDFDYQLECYVPEGKRVYGYFVLPVLWRGRLVARTDLKAHRNLGVLEVRCLVPEPGLRATDRFAVAFARALRDFAAFNGCQGVDLSGRVPRALAASVKEHLPGC